MKRLSLRSKLVLCLFFVFFLCGSAFAEEVYMPHITGGNTGWTDWLQVNNGDSSTHDFKITLYSDGTQVYSNIHTVVGYGHQQIAVKSLDDSADMGKIEYTSEALTFRLSYENTSEGVAEFSLSDSLCSTMGLFYSGFVSSITAKGAAIANMGGIPAYVTFYAIGQDSIMDTYSTTIDAYEKIVGLHDTWFPTISLSDIESIVAVSNVQGLSGIVICSNADGSDLLFTPGKSMSVFDTSFSPNENTWAFSAGESGHEYGINLLQASDGGYVVTGYTTSYGAGNYDLWVLKLDSSGNTQWQKTYGGSDLDFGYCINQSTDGGYVVTGSTNSYGAGNYDIWVLKLDSSGNTQWQKTYGGTDSDYGYCINQTSDGGYAVTGSTTSYGAGNADLWVIKLDSSGNTQWQKTYGGSSSDFGYCINQSTDGDYVVTGFTDSYGAGNVDLWVLRLDSSGDIPGCIGTTITDTTISPVNSTCTPAATSVTPLSISSTVDSTFVSGTDSNAVITFQCTN
jgi:hypothetical protein